jgi:transposase-like protein
MLNESNSREKAEENRCRRHQRLWAVEVDQILREYQNAATTVKEIAHKHAISMARVTCLARRGGLPLRGRGRKPSIMPSDGHLKILEAVQHATMAEVATRYGCSKQRIFQVVDRWRNWMARDGLPADVPASEPEPPARPPKKPARELMVSFRLTSLEADALLSVLDSLGLRGSMSLAAGARALLLMFVGLKSAVPATGQIVYENHRASDKGIIANGNS